MQVEHRITIATPPETIFQIYEDVQNWHTWDLDTKQAFIQGSFRVGARGRITPPKGMSVPMLFTQVEPDKCFTVESKIPLFCMVFEHELIPTSGCDRGDPPSDILGPMLSKQLNAGLPVTLRNLKTLAEKTNAA